MAWNGYRGDWQQEGWNGWKSNVWYEQPNEGSYAHNHEEYSSWPPSNGGTSQQSSGGYGANARPSANQSRIDNDPPKPKICSFDALRALQGDSDCDSDTEAGISLHHRSDSTAGSGSSPIKSRSDSSDDEKREVGKSATQAERDEAEQVVRQALSDVKERDSMRKKVSGASHDDLQAMLNARLNPKR
jgi:hypothetical protein